MSVTKDRKHWFAAKTYGYGWGAATCWQGWAVYIGYIVLLVVAAVVLKPDRDPRPFWIALIVLSALLMAVCYAKGEPARWRWGKPRG